jgi:RNA polymerase sigma factor (sigma-70 family)
MLTRLIPLAKLDDARLTVRIGAGDAEAFSVLYDRHHAPLLAFCRHMLGNRQDGEDALQQTFVRAHRAMLRGQQPDEPRAWLFAIARNRCRTMLSARRDVVADGADELERVCTDGFTAEVQQRAELRELLADMTKLPEDQRAALLLSELRGFSQEQIALVIGCPAQKVKALVFQARTHLLAERESRDTDCIEIRQQLEVARGGELRRGLLRRHLRRCEPCKTYSLAVAAQRNELAGLMGVLPSAALKLSVLGAVGLAGGDGAAGAPAGLAGAGGLAAGAGGSGSGAGGSAAAGGAATIGGVSASGAGGVATKLAAVKVAAVLAVSGGAAGGAAEIVNRDGKGAEPPAVQRSEGARTHTSRREKRSARRHKLATRSVPASTHSQLERQRRKTRSKARAGKRGSSAGKRGNSAGKRGSSAGKRGNSRTRARSSKPGQRSPTTEHRTARRKTTAHRPAIRSAAAKGSKRRDSARRPRPRQRGATTERPKRQAAERRRRR